MPEISNNAAILIATSFQALNRTKAGDKSTMICNCTVAILFAGFFIEENLDVIIKKINKENEMKKFLKIRKHDHPGLLDKLAWYFNCYVANPKADGRENLFTNKLEGRLNKRFPGFGRIYQIRNDVAHGKINRRLNINETEKLRIQAKAIVDDLLDIVAITNKIPRNITY
jgi:hypothetical protein